MKSPRRERRPGLDLLAGLLTVALVAGVALFAYAYYKGDVSEAMRWGTLCAERWPIEPDSKTYLSSYILGAAHLRLGHTDQALRMLPDDLSIEPYAIALPRGDWELRLAVNTALAEIYRGGEVKNIYDRWFGQLGIQPGILLTAAYVLGALPE